MEYINKHIFFPGRILALNLIDFLLKSQKLNEMYEFLHLYSPRFYVLSMLFNWFVNIVSKYIPVSDLSIGLILDGNRRYAKLKGIKKEKGHLEGKETAIRMIRYLSKSKCKSVSLFIFGKKNFQRSKEEVSSLMDIFFESFSYLKNQKTSQSDPNSSSFIDKVKIVGDLSMVREDVQKLCLEINSNCPDKKKFFFLLSYSAIDEYINSKNDGVDFPIDIIVRTGGERRLSDFLLCNAAKGSMLVFSATKWPMFTKLHMLLVFLKYRLEQSITHGTIPKHRYTHNASMA
ncbi:ditrans,polycis-polyprenyl diphosphate synthase [Nematocida sp. LUAm3]|nr:ditrans,polycis-polyprenyl diphosphate synthase [Nematocida sp. LUAm3]KAI5175488.1 ditrans,polycis-polyprenyl diphosphate synthase [Nematocida sp. LUAm2]KAI5178482.1 ditrans,polycis-polyprenyl diphosphate synthase [Nematocida sp. LUAm1]